ncbi:MAG: leucine--tRNA ligase [archaeon]
MSLDYKKVSEKWQKKWLEAKVFEPEIDKNKKPFYIQVAYPYPSGVMHIGHARTYVLTDSIARYYRMKGFNSLLPMGWHVTGSPVITGVELVKERNEKTVKVMTENFKIPVKDLKELETAEGFVEYFVNKAEYGYKAGFKRLGLGIDWRRELRTNDKNYSKFIEWQYQRLNDKKLIGKGKYPVRFCPKDNEPVGDADLREGEGIGIQEFTLMKFKFEDKLIMAATLRPETVFGITNMWVDPKETYFIVKVDKEKWIVSKKCFEKLKHQKDKVEKVGEITGKEMIGKTCIAPLIEKEVVILPSSFIDSNIGSGIVTSVPSHAPFDWQALKDLQAKEKKWADIKPIGLIELPGYSEHPAKDITEQMKIESQKELDKLEKAKKVIYKAEFHSGIMKENTGKFKGLKVEEAKEKVKKLMLKEGLANKFFELEGKIVCRCGTEGIVKVLDDQWFVLYSDEKWKKEAKETLKEMNIVPDFYRLQYEKVFDWLDDKPCTRSKGLGTKFPWDKTKVIEALGDSTIYMAYFTISHLIKKIEPEKLTPEVFDYVFYGKGEAEKLGVDKKLLDEMKENFDYWYPLAFNTSGTELLPNHMSFSIFQHTALFPKEKRQNGTLNLGMLIIEGQKMSSSKGNVVLINDISDKLGADFVRFFLLSFNEPWQKTDWRQSNVESGTKIVSSLFNKMLELSKKVKKAGKLEERKLSLIEKWLYNKFNERINTARKSFDNFEIRKALLALTFNFANDLKWFERRHGKWNENTGALFKEIVVDWVKALTPVTPHFCEEIWQEGLGNKEFVIVQDFPKERKVKAELDIGEELIRNVLEDVNNVKVLAKITTPKKISLIVASEWKKELLKELIEMAKKERLDFGKAMNYAMQKKELKDKGKTVQGFLKQAVKRINELKEKELFIDEEKAISEAQDFLQKELNLEIKVEKESESKNPKAVNAFPLKPAIVLE